MNEEEIKQLSPLNIEISPIKKKKKKKKKN